MELLFAAIYVYSPQGRISGILDMKMCQVEDLLGPGVIILHCYICIHITAFEIDNNNSNNSNHQLTFAIYFYL